MIRFAYHRAETVEDAIRLLAAEPTAKPLAGGTNLVDLLKYDVEAPTTIVDLNRLPFRAIEETDEGGLRLGALVSNNDTAYDPRVQERFPLLSNAILAGATGQLRNAATNGGNLNQRTRCYYFYDVATPCNKRQPGSGCGALGGVNRIHAILGTSEQCIATHPSDMAVALAALEAVVVVHGPAGIRRIPLEEYHVLPESHPERDNVLQPGDLVTALELAPCSFGKHWTYLKLRDRQSYAFAVVSVAAGLQLEGDRIRQARLALGGVAHKPWRDPGAEALLEGQPPSRELFLHVATHLLRNAKGFGGNDFKVELARRAVVRALTQATAGTPQPIAHKRIV